MNREIKFRVRQISTGKFVGYECLMPDISNQGNEWAKSFAGTDWEQGTYDQNYFLREQFTGLHDKNGNEIYEGDLVSIPYVDPLGGLHTETRDRIAEIGFGHGRFTIKDKNEDMQLSDWCEKSKGEYISNYGNPTVFKESTVLEIIGNIYENPDLTNPTT